MALSYASDIRPLFRDSDIETMRDIADFDLGKYEDVQNRADIIYSRLRAGDMPCDEAWSDDKVDKFKRWMDEGMKP